MLIVYKGAGNHSNRLFQAIHFEAFCLENELAYLNPSFKDMADYFGLEQRIWHKPFCTILQNLNKVKLLKGLDCSDDGEQQSYEETIKNKKRVLVKGWNFRVFDLTAKFQDYFVKKYSLLPIYYQNNTLYRRISKMDRNIQVVVGVHIRRGDYRSWQDGKYFFSDDVYQEYMNSLRIKLEQSFKKPVFIIFSNEDVSIAEKENVILSRNDWYIDQFLMSQCDYLIGPPSTFTLWASYIGKVRYFHFEDDQTQVDLDNFQYCIG